jgi:hypothetical protein
MKSSSYNLCRVLILLFALGWIIPGGCRKKSDNPIIYKLGTFPDTIMNLSFINSQYDDYNMDIYEITGNGQVIFSSNRKSSGGQFDLEQAEIRFSFDQTSGDFHLQAGMTNDPFLSKLIQQSVTSANDFGPYRFLSTPEYEFLVVSSVNAQGNLDLLSYKNIPYFGKDVPVVEGPFPAYVFNSDANDAYFCLNSRLDTAYFASDRDGNFDIYMQKRPAGKKFDSWFGQGFITSLRVDSINSDNADICPMIYKNVLVLASNRSGGLGDYDLYYSLLVRGKWTYPLNLGPKINSAYSEYRPVIGSHPEFTNYFLMFSSNRPGGKGGFDLYFTSLNLKKD